MTDKQKAAFFDLDGTLRYSNNGVFINDKKEVMIFEGVPAKLWGLRENNYLLIGITNQAGVERGYMTEVTLKDNLARTQNLLGPAALDRIYYCTMIESHKRKPNPGMIDDACKDFDIDLSGSFMVGDRPADQGFAKNAGIEFFWANAYFGRNGDNKV